jgi:hypothetical protein
MPGYPCLLLSPPLTPVDQPGPGRAETAWPDPSRPARPRSESRSESAGSIRVFQPDPSRSGPIRVIRREPSPHGRIRVYARFRCGLFVLPYVSAMTGTGIFPSSPLPPVRSSHDGHRSTAHHLKGVRGYRAIARRRRRGRRRSRPAATQEGAVRREFDSRRRPRVVQG